MPLNKDLKQHKVIFDTHVLLWHLSASNGLSLKFQKKVEHLQQINPILISLMSFWEIGMLVEKGRINLAMDAMEWVERALLTAGFEVAPLTPQVAVESSRLPGNLHGDPVDRILIATAIQNHAVLVTCDEKILNYAKHQSVQVYDPRG